MQEYLHDPVNAWLFAGALIIAFEAFTSPGLGLFLGGLGAITTALIIKAGVVNEASIPAQFAWCFGTTVAWTGILWKPLRKFRMQHKTRSSGILKNNNIIGEIATVGKDGLLPGEVGQVIWSGSTWNATLDAAHAIPLAQGARVLILAVSGNTLTVTPQ